MKFQIKKRFSVEVLFETEAESLKQTLEKAVAEKKDLGGADLGGAYLGGAYLGGADLGGADLGGAYLGGADLRGAYLGGADLRGADLGGAYLGGADLRGADLGGADLRGAKWDDTKKDMFEKMALMPNEVPYLYKSLHDGKVDGSAYTGECACFCGTLANAKKVEYQELPIVADATSPVERFFTSIRKGDTPDNNPISKLASEWIIEFCKEKEIMLPTREVIWK